MPISRSDFQYVSSLVRQHAAIVLEDGKEYLVESRLLSLARRTAYKSAEELIAAMRRESFGPLHRSVIDAMTTNETSFFRDLPAFEMLKKGVFPELLKARAQRRELNLWCAASSSGQEPFSVAFMLRDSFPELASWRLSFLATDISDEMLARCREGKYSQLEVNRGLPAPLLVKHFVKQGLEWQVKDEVRKLIDFRSLNLAEAWPRIGPFDVVFIRNVLIYFDLQTKRTILGRIRQLLQPDGYLVLGAAETTLNVDESFDRIPFERTACYRPRAKVGA